MSRSWLLHLDDMIESAEKIGRFVARHSLEIIWEIATQLVPRMLSQACRAREQAEQSEG